MVDLCAPPIPPALDKERPDATRDRAAGERSPSSPRLEVPRDLCARDLGDLAVPTFSSTCIRPPAAERFLLRVDLAAPTFPPKPPTLDVRLGPARGAFGELALRDSVLPFGVSRSSDRVSGDSELALRDFLDLCASTKFFISLEDSALPLDVAPIPRVAGRESRVAGSSDAVEDPEESNEIDALAVSPPSSDLLDSRDFLCAPRDLDDLPVLSFGSVPA